MAALGAPRTWIPYMNNKDCSDGFCSLYCPQWCYAYLSPPPPLIFPGDGDDSNPNFSPLVIAIIGILASAFLLVSYYAIISKYCGNRNESSRRSRRGNEIHDQDGEFRENHNPSLHEPWHTVTTGLDEALIKSITVCKYKKGDGLIEGTDCSVCLSEFEEDESLKLLPKCSHAFHVPCIETWLKSHSNCPLCRANIFFISASSLPTPTLPPPVIELTPQNIIQSSQDTRPCDNDDSAVTMQDAQTELRISEEEETTNIGRVPRTPFRVLGNSGNSVPRNSTVIDIGGEEHEYRHLIRRAASMDHPCQTHHGSADDAVTRAQDCLEEDSLGSAKLGSLETSKSSGNINRSSNRVSDLKRSFSSGRFFLIKHGRISDATNPV